MNYSRNFVYIIYISSTSTLTNIQTYKTYRKVFILKNNVLSHVTGPSLGSDGRLHAALYSTLYSSPYTVVSRYRYAMRRSIFLDVRAIFYSNRSLAIFLQQERKFYEHFALTVDS
jgi:hypothetical protein